MSFHAIYPAHFRSGWDAETACGLGLGVTAGLRLDTRLMNEPLISGVHFSVGYLLGQTHLWIGVSAYRTKNEPRLQYLRLTRLL